MFEVLLVCFDKFICVVSAPTVAPQDIQLQALAAHSILVKWKVN